MSLKDAQERLLVQENLRLDERIAALEAERDKALDVCRKLIERHDHPGGALSEHALYEQALAAWNKALDD